jgi:uncharacterized ubiquitin-like protein YukD
MINIKKDIVIDIKKKIDINLVINHTIKKMIESIEESQVVMRKEGEGIDHLV